MSPRSDRDRLRDIAGACVAITSYRERIDVDEEIVYDAIRARLIEIGEAVKDLDAALTILESDIPWKEIARMRDHLTHRYFDSVHSIVRVTADRDIPMLAAAVERLLL